MVGVWCCQLHVTASLVSSKFRRQLSSCSGRTVRILKLPCIEINCGQLRGMEGAACKIITNFLFMCIVRTMGDRHNREYSELLQRGKGTVDALTLTMQAKRVAVECHKECCLKMGYDYGVLLIKECIDEIGGLSRKEKKAYLLSKIRSCVNGYSSKGYTNADWVIGIAPGNTLKVCKQCFCSAYSCGHTFVDELCRRIKEGEKSVDRNDFHDQRPGANAAFLKNLTQLADALDITLSPSQLGALVVPNTVASLTCFAWMKDYFDAVGDKQPNANEIHLEPTDIKSIWSEYRLVIGDVGQPTLSYGSFLNLWDICFSHVKLREYKAVTGKCKICALLSEARRKVLGLAGRRFITELHALHRTMYMGERLSYYARRNEAMLMPHMYWSGISDGMQQSHCLLPHRANMVPFSPTLPQHLQGVIQHGRSIEIYRTFHNLKNNANLSIHCLLKSLEQLHRAGGSIPDVLYYQVDGGSENTSNAVFGITELIVVRGLAKRVVITRLPVGHTHEDIDSKFAIIWKRVRNAFVLSPLAYAAAIEQALTTGATKCTVHDIYIVPNYTAYILPFMDQSFGR